MKIKRDILLNYISLIVMAATGLLLNTIIAAYYGIDSLGIFNETYAWYMVLSQISVWGIHMAIVKFVPETYDQELRGSILKTGLFVTIIISIFLVLISELIVIYVINGPFSKSMSLAFLGLIFISVNKVLQNYINAIEKMAAYALITSLRYIVLGLSALLFSIARIQAVYLSLVFPITEIIVLLFLLVFFVIKIPVKGTIKKTLIKEILSFSTTILPSYLVTELNTKVDVICLGFLLNDPSQIGVYSFAILFTEGFYMLYIVIRKIINPSLAESNAYGNIKEKVRNINNKLKRYLIPGGMAAYVIVAIVFYLICQLLNRAEYRVGLVYILIICGSMIINGKFIVFGDLFAQVGLPLEESILNILTVISNFVLNVMMVLLFGTIGAAIATAISYGIYSFYLRKRINKRTGIVINWFV